VGKTDYERLRRIPVDPRVTLVIERNPNLLAEQTGAMSSWGGPSQYRRFMRLPIEQRLCYAAILEGVTQEDQIGVVTGLSSKEISRGLQGLQKRGLVKLEKRPM